MKRFFLITLTGIVLVANVQSRTITGVVTDAKSKPLDHATIKIGDNKVVSNASGQFTYTTDLAIDNAVVYKNSFQFKKITVTQSVDNYSVKLDSAVYSKEFAPPLRVVGGMIYNAKDQPMCLQGLSIHEAKDLKESDFVNWTQNWKINVVRLVMHNHDRQEADWPAYLNSVDSVMKWTKKYKVYVLVDGYHEGGASGSVVSHWDRVQKVWDRLMPRLKNYDHVIWQIYNEPNGEGGNEWVDWVPYAKILVDKIRSYKPIVNAVTVPAALWAQSLDLTKANLDRDEIIYSFHPYFGRPSPHTPLVWDQKIGYLQKQDIAPVFCSEWAAHDGSGDTVNQLNTYYRPLLRYLQNNNIHFTHWGYFPSWGGMANLVSNRIGETEKRTLWGDLLYSYFNGSKWDSLMALPSVPGKFEAEDFINYDGLRTENCSDAGGGKSLAYVTNGSWTSYSVNSKSKTWNSFTIRVSSGGSGGKVTLYVDDQKKCSVDIPSTGGWQVWKTFTAADNFEISSGDHQIKLEYSGSSGLFNVNWFTIDQSTSILPVAHQKVESFNVSNYGNKIVVNFPNVFNSKSVALYSISGKLVQRVPVIGSHVVLQTDKLSNGSYIVNAEGDRGLRRKLMISGNK